MKKETIAFSRTRQFAPMVDEYLNGDPALSEFYRFRPELNSFAEAIGQRKKFPADRQVLYQALAGQYRASGISPETVGRNLELLKEEETYTVTTGHQLNLFTGPLYFIYKIATTIKLASELSKAYPGKNFVPVYWMASEDHDFEEIKSVSVFGQQVSWNQPASGPVGCISTEGITDTIAKIREAIGNRYQLPEIFETAYTQSENLAIATRKMVHTLFSEYGLVIIDGNDPALKRIFIPEMRREILENVSFQSVQKTNESFSKNYKVQITPREINLFYMKPGMRERIVQEATDRYTVLNTPISFTRDELLAELESYPERFSPNVVLRPLYEEKILPNLAYIGGPGEVNYWLQLMQTFDAFGIPYPVLMLRNCILLLNHSANRKMQKLGFETEDLFQSTEFLTLKLLERDAETHVGTEKQAGAIQKVFDELSALYHKLDPTLASSAEAEKQKILNSLKHLEEKARRTLKKKNETLVNQVKSLKEQLMPGGGLQERSDNLLSHCNGDVHSFVKQIMDIVDPFVKEFVVVSTEND